MRLSPLSVNNIFRLSDDSTSLDHLGALALRQHFLHWTDGKVYVSTDLSKPITAIHRIVSLLKTDRGSALQISASNGELARLELTSLGKALIYLREIDFEFLEFEYMAYVFSPVLKQVKELIRRLPPGWNTYLTGWIPASMAEFAIKETDRAVRLLRKRLSRSSLKAANDNFRHSSIETFNHLCDQLTWLAEEHEEIVVLRFDLHGARENSGDSRVTQKPTQQAADQFQKARLKFHRSMDRKYSKVCLGYACAFEHGVYRGFHMHYVVLLEKPGHENHVEIIEELAAKWEKLTDGKGYLYNCNQFPERYLRRGVGIVNLSDSEAVEGLRYIAAYFTLAGLYVRLDPALGYDAFSSGRLPKVPPKPNPKGRPRKREQGSRFRVAFAQYEKSRVSFM